MYNIQQHTHHNTPHHNTPHHNTHITSHQTDLEKAYMYIYINI